jgi:hypothetical protein
MEVWNSSRIPKMVVRQASPTVKSVEARLTLSCRCNYVIFFEHKGHFVMNKYLYYWTWNLVIILLLYVWFEHPVHAYGGFVPSFLERGMTPAKNSPLSPSMPEIAEVVADQGTRSLLSGSYMCPDPPLPLLSHALMDIAMNSLQAHSLQRVR